MSSFSSRLRECVGKIAAESAKYDLLSVIRNAVFIIAIYSYFTGWVYAYYYLRHFGVALYSIDIPFHSFFVHSYDVVRGFFGIIVIVGSLSFLLFALIFPRYKLVIVLLLIALFPVLFSMAEEAAERSAVAVRRGRARTISFVLNEAHAKFYPKVFLKANREKMLRLVTETKDKFVVVYQPQGESGAMPYGQAFIIPRSEILLADIEVPNPSIRGGVK